MKDKIGVVAINEFIGWKPKMYLFLVDHNSGHKKAKVLNKDVVVTIRHNEYKVILLNKKCLRHLLNRIQSKVIEQELIKPTKPHRLVLMTKYISKTIDMMINSRLSELVIKKVYLFRKYFCQAIKVLF